PEIAESEVLESLDRPHHEAPNKDPEHPKFCPRVTQTQRSSRLHLIPRPPPSAMSAIRAIRQFSIASSRAFAARSAVRPLARAALAARPLSAARAFSVSARVLGEGVSDVALSQKLQEELKYEKEIATPAEPDFLKAFKAHGIWTVEDTAGSDEVTLTRKFGNESIRLMFSIAEIQTDQEPEFESNLEEGEEAEANEEEVPSTPYPIRTSFSITKTGSSGALTIDAMCQDGAFIIDNISFYNDAQVGTELTAEADWKRRGLYLGPQFDTLDVSLQEEFEKFLHERGISEHLAFFIPEYAEHKEQKEYVSWLENVKTFIEQ
ncbi:Mitochondrial acidic protein mam33, partial [Grifola frondosa]